MSRWNKENIVSNNFDRELQKQIDGILPVGHIYNLGRPSEILRCTGFPDRDIELSSTRLAEKAYSPKHPFQLSEVKGLVSALRDPIAVFQYGNIEQARNVIVRIETQGRKFLAGIHVDKGNSVAAVTDIRNLFGKDTMKWLNWIGQGKSLYLNKDEVQAIIAEQRTNRAEVSYVDLDFIAKVVKNFENPKFLGEKIESLDEYFDKSDDLPLNNDKKIDFSEENNQSTHKSFHR